MKRIIFIALVFTIVISSCVDKNKFDKYLDFRSGSADVNLGSVFTINKKITFKLAKESVFSFPFRFCVLKDYFIITSERSSIKVFDRYGKFVKNIGRIGDGPGEFHRITHVFYISDKVFGVFDPALYRVSLFDINIGFIKMFQLKLPGIVDVKSIENYAGNYYIHVPYTKSQPYNVIVYDSLFNKKESFLHADDAYRGYNFFGLFYGNIFISRDSAVLYEMNSFSKNCIMKYDLLSKRITKIDFGNNSFFQPIPEQKETLTSMEPTMKIFNKGTNISNFMVLENRYIVVNYIVNNLSPGRSKTVLYDIKTLKKYNLNAYPGVISDGKSIFYAAFVYNKNKMNEPDFTIYEFKIKKENL